MDQCGYLTPNLLQTWKLYFICILLMDKDLHHLVQNRSQSMSKHGSTNYLPKSTTRFHATIPSPFDYHSIKESRATSFCQETNLLLLRKSCPAAEAPFPLWRSPIRVNVANKCKQQLINSWIVYRKRLRSKEWCIRLSHFRTFQCFLVHLLGACSIP